MRILSSLFYADNMFEEIQWRMKSEKGQEEDKKRMRSFVLENMQHYLLIMPKVPIFISTNFFIHVQSNWIAYANRYDDWLDNGFSVLELRKYGNFCSIFNFVP